MPKPEGNAFQTRLYDAGNAASNRWRNTPFGGYGASRSQL